MFTNVPLFPESASTHASDVDAVFFFALAVMIFFTTLIAVLIITFAIKYRRRSDADRPPHIGTSLALELTWTVIPLLICLVLFTWGTRSFFSLQSPPDDAMEVFMVAKQWMWKSQHLSGQREINQLHVPVGRPIKVTFTSQDVIHSFFVPAFRIHQDVLPGRYVSTWFQATKPGRYHLFCSQYCGTDHSRMVGEVIVMEQNEFQTWLNEGVDGSMAAEGRKLFRKLQCITCHSADAKARAPVLEGLYGTEVRLQDGRTVRADENYIRASILTPEFKLVEGYKSIMPPFRGQVNEEEVLQLVAFIKGLGPGQTPRRTEDSEPPERLTLPRADGAKTQALPAAGKRKE